MYVLISHFQNGSVTYSGPFHSQAQARVYALNMAVAPYRWHVVKLCVPGRVQSGVEYKLPDEDSFVTRINPRVG